MINRKIAKKVSTNLFSSALIEVDPEISSIINKETKRQNEYINLIASENYASKAISEALASPLQNKYSEVNLIGLSRCKILRRN